MKKKQFNELEIDEIAKRLVSNTEAVGNGSINVNREKGGEQTVSFEERVE